MTVFVSSRVKIIDQSYKMAKALSRKERTVLFRTGGYVRKVMRSRIRRRKKVSTAGQYPSAHVKGNSGLKEIYFKVDRDGANIRKLAGDYSVAVGHLKYSRNKKAAVPIGKTVPQLINEGGRAYTPRRARRYRDTDGLKRTRRRVNKYRARPFRKLTMPDAIKNLRLNMRRVRFG